MALALNLEKNKNRLLPDTTWKNPLQIDQIFKYKKYTKGLFENPVSYVNILRVGKTVLSQDQEL